MRGKSTENEIATGSSICSKDSLSLLVKFFFLLSANCAFVFFLGPCFGFFFRCPRTFLYFLTRFTTSIRPKRETKSDKTKIENKREAKSHVNKTMLTMSM